MKNKLNHYKQDLPRKLKKKLYGKKGRRKSLVKFLLEEKGHKTIKVLVKAVSPSKKPFPLSFLTEGTSYKHKEEFNWDISTKNA